MRRIHYLLVLAVLALVSCGGKQQSRGGEAADSTAVQTVTADGAATAAQQKTEESVANFVRSVYANFDWNNADSIYCTEDWWAHYKRIDQWDNAQDNAESRFFIEDGHWDGNTDLGECYLDSIRVDPIEGDATIVQFELHEKAMPDSYDTFYWKVCWDGSRWLIDDFLVQNLDPDDESAFTSMKQQMRQFLSLKGSLGVTWSAEVKDKQSAHPRVVITIKRLNSGEVLGQVESVLDERPNDIDDVGFAVAENEAEDMDADGFNDIIVSLGHYGPDDLQRVDAWIWDEMRLKPIHVEGYSKLSHPTVWPAGITREYIYEKGKGEIWREYEIHHDGTIEFIPQ